MRVTVLFYFVVILVISESRFLLKEFASKKVRERRADTCIAEGRRYQDGDTIVFHNITTPVDMAMCTQCRCFAGNIGACRSYLCDLGQQPALVRACEQWKVREEGECCPKCGTNNNSTRDSTPKSSFSLGKKSAKIQVLLIKADPIIGRQG
ncbi:PREDICTED: uncharacterized protein LOC107343357 [Acropora digitifera]|uniref:uncharacterized protein LOC107343357 n=1 Tax=Acropora digitifera TaxID=70779 RepID=UPI00077AB5BD|nr:PREDICTED: uncharacterized protein LOC107343357 [Acropora digitifera]XP_015764408.1 PREDICTED: uncharacterized protein LOC107343357 [Acropora digitifera]